MPARMFNGREFVRYGSYNSIDSVNDAIKRLKTSGWYTRVVDTGRIYEIWIREHEERHNERKVKK